MKNRVRIIGIILSLTILTSSYFIPPEFHIEFLYSLIVLLTIWIPGIRSSFDTSVILSGLIIFGHILHRNISSFNEYFIVFLAPLLFIWAFAYTIIKYKQSQEKLHTSTEHLNAMFQHATEGIIISNTKGVIVMANPRAMTQFGYIDKPLVGSSIEDLIPRRFSEVHPVHRKGYYRELHNRPMGTGMSLSARRYDNTEFPVEISLSSFRIKEELFVISFIIDITERKKHEELVVRVNEELEQRVEQRTRELAEVNLSLARANVHLKQEMEERSKIEEALRDSERLYSTIARNFPKGIICVLDSDLNIVFIDGKELQVLGLKRDEMTGKFFTQLPFLKEDSQIAQNLRQIFEWESASFEYNYNNDHYNMSGVPLPDTKGVVKDILLVIQNVTDLKRAELEILQSLKKERMLNEMKSKFVSIASHEFRTPLSTILSSVSLVDKYGKPEDSEKREKHILRIKSSVKNLTEILNDFLSLEKLEAGVIEVREEDFDIIAFAEELKEEMQSTAKPGQEIIYSHEGGTREIYLDKHLLRNICINLLNNAIKYSPGNKPIEFSSRVDGKIRLSVKDYGLGIPEEEQSQLFERFFRAANVTGIQGTGLGLNIVRRYVKLMKGSIEFASEINKGTTFTIIFPQPNK